MSTRGINLYLLSRPEVKYEQSCRFQSSKKGVTTLLSVYSRMEIRSPLSYSHEGLGILMSLHGG